MSRFFISRSLYRLCEGATVSLLPTQAHHLLSVLRKKNGDTIAVFNEIDGEWTAQIQIQKKSDVHLIVQDCIRAPGGTEDVTRCIHLLFGLLKPDALHFLVEKATELGVTDFHPLITQHCHVRQVNPERLLKTSIDAVQQCERLDVPRWHEALPLTQRVLSWPSSVPILFCQEREQLPSFYSVSRNIDSDVGIMIGPEGGWQYPEIALMQNHDFIHCVHLGSRILRAETAALAALAIVNFSS